MSLLYSFIDGLVVVRQHGGGRGGIAGLETIADSFGGLVTNLTLAVYGVVIVLTALVQGLNARYYFVRIERVEHYVRETPGWIVEIQRSTSAL